MTRDTDGNAVRLTIGNWLGLLTLAVTVAGTSIGTYVSISNQMAKLNVTVSTHDEEIGENRDTIRKVSDRLTAHVSDEQLHHARFNKLDGDIGKLVIRIDELQRRLERERSE